MPAIRADSGKMMAPSTNAIGQAIRADFGQTESHRAVGPREIKVIIPDMEMAMKNVIMT